MFGADAWPDEALVVRAIRAPHHRARFRLGDIEAGGDEGRRGEDGEGVADGDGLPLLDEQAGRLGRLVGERHTADLGAGGVLRVVVLGFPLAREHAKGHGALFDEEPGEGQAVEVGERRELEREPLLGARDGVEAELVGCDARRLGDGDLPVDEVADGAAVGWEVGGGARIVGSGVGDGSEECFQFQWWVCDQLATPGRDETVWLDARSSSSASSARAASSALRSGTAGRCLRAILRFLPCSMMMRFTRFEKRYVEYSPFSLPAAT